MIVVDQTKDLFAWLDSAPQQTLGLVPTMGYLHAGHASLVERAKRENQRVAVSIFVNPLQFNNAEDLKNYPRNPAQDLKLLENAGCDLVFLPAPELIYPAGFDCKVTVGELSRPLEGSARPGHFDGVTTIVSKLFHLFTPTCAYFGEKDAQQLLVIQKMVQDLNFRLTIVPCPTLREPDGLAMSSRNARLSPDQRAEAMLLYKALSYCKDRIEAGAKDASELIAEMAGIVESSVAAVVDYIAISDPKDLSPVNVIESEVLVSLAVYLGQVRLIDNLKVSPP
ncbi:MAG: pantoate--beta-alanine ligase [Candidatus Lambdaproteobacteria bacterium RIFOXYD1_FULL_56_27]|uniref:Pantothenate synthetase n=1 Tax=Candidatus Lambdaproteobacteria bacterium RIFOXYD2_FULL_56_26 TaxID=1817773 RepID=A0A1F6GUQ6_9PROT|nr:MAG: pantoate--beta-alanine ligase [Candidatus Lambdaproteobacteria bacterium RIFOXYD2_FULL_56_26]OGH02301.1 MAG: pantoate--beta-alanine ligase [Candidatus Lambdaproteobacteria bacterium RIFOXYC1_FULL_56_13]OGH10071.1 MAG: pantoate--beta-alanine ligase [Candidatus Lambdaproteobacteria bacterium RIFOXYD1_FULL_56_27]